MKWENPSDHARYVVKDILRKKLVMDLRKD
jgi:hypothetical protein